MQSKCKLQRFKDVFKGINHQILPSNYDSRIWTLVAVVVIVLVLILIWPSYLFDFFKIGFATFAGAFFAFKIEKNYKERQEKIKNFRSGKRAQFALMSQYQSLLPAKRDNLDPLEKDKNRHITLLPFPHYSQYDKIDIEALLFILDEPDKNILNELSVANNKFQTILGTIEKRNEEHEDFQKRSAKIGEEGALNIATYHILKDLTDSLYDQFEDSMETSLELHQKLYSFLKMYYEKGKPLEPFIVKPHIDPQAEKTVRQKE